MNEQAMADMEARVRRLERQIRVLVVLLCTTLVSALALSSIAVSNAQSTVLTAAEVRAQRFTLLDPKGEVADDWFSLSSPREGVTTHAGGPYSGWGFSRP